MQHGAEAKAGCPSDSLYGEPLCLTFAAYICGRYPVKAQRPPAANHKFSHAEVRKLMDYIHAHLGTDFSLVELANLVHLSPRHCSRLFRNTFGTTPYRGTS